MNSYVSTTTLNHSKSTDSKKSAVKEILKYLIALFTLFSCNYAVSATINVDKSSAPVITLDWPALEPVTDFELYFVRVGYQNGQECFMDYVQARTLEIDLSASAGCASASQFEVNVYTPDDSWEWPNAPKETTTFQLGSSPDTIIEVDKSSAPIITLKWPTLEPRAGFELYFVRVGYQNGQECFMDYVQARTVEIDLSASAGCANASQFEVNVYTPDDSWEWPNAPKDTTTFTIDGEPPTSDFPVFSYSELIGNVPARPGYSLAELAAITPELPVKTPELPGGAVIPPVDIVNTGICSSPARLQMDNGKLPKPPVFADGKINWRRNTNRNNPIIWMVAAANGVDITKLTPDSKDQIWNTVNERFARLLAESLPMSSRIDSRDQIFNNEDELSNFRFKAGVYNNADEGPLMEHFLISYLIPYAELVEGVDVATFEAAKKAIQGHARWMASLKTDLHGTNGPAFIVGATETGDVNHHDSVRITNFRVFMRLFKNMVLFSESRFVKEIGIDDELVIEANKMLNWLNAQQAGGSSDLHNVGWVNLHGIPAYYFDPGTTIRPNAGENIPDQRIVWTRLMELWHGVLEQVSNTEYYRKNKHNGVMDALFEKTQNATTGIVNSSVNYAVPTVSNNLPASFTNYRAHGWYLDITSFSQCHTLDGLGKCHEVFSNPNEQITPKDFFQNYSLADFKEHISHICDFGPDVEWYRYLPAAVSTYTRLK
jgi:hypothetical protein